MKKYDTLMQNLRFREDFCEDTLKKAQEKTKKRMPRGLAIAACICLSTVVLVDTALAVPQIRQLLFTNRTIETVEVAALPEDNGGMLENTLDVVTARYYKLDGRLNAHEGIGSAIPVEKNGKTTIYTIGEDGELVRASAPRVIQKEISYAGKDYALDMQIYGGDNPTVVNGERIFPLMSDNTYVLGKTQNGVKSPIFLNLNTWEIEDPMENVSFTAPEGAVQTLVSAAERSAVLLLKCEMQDETCKIYLAERESGEVRFVEEAGAGEWFRSGEKIYRYRDGLLSVLDADGSMVPEFDGKACVYPGNHIAYVVEGNDIRLLLLPTGEEIVMENTASMFGTNLFAAANQDKTKICVTAPIEEGQFECGILAIADMSTGAMVSLERMPGMDEEMSGWFDNETYMIAGTVGEQWYVCLYSVDE